MLVTTHVLQDRTQANSLKFTFKCYRPQYSTSSVPQANKTALVFAHCVGTHKETWQPTIERIFQHQAVAISSNGRIVTEAWCSDSPNHGQAGIINEVELIKSWEPQGIDGRGWATGIVLLLKSSLISAPNVIGIGHSAGVVIMILSTCFFPLDHIPYASMIMVEPPMMNQHLMDSAYQEQNALTMVIEVAKTRRDRWKSREEAHRYFKSRIPWKIWHPRILELYTEYGLRDLPTAAYPNLNEGVTLSATRAQEVAGYSYPQDGVESLDVLSKLCARIPVHCILGGRLDLIPKENHEACCDASAGRRMTSISVIEGAGHLVVQEAPGEVADSILAAIRLSSGEKARL